MGAQILHQLLPEGTVDLFAVISSSSVVIGGAGQTDYVAANAVLEAVAAQRSDGMSIAWGVWRDTGMAARSYGAGEAAGDGLLGLRTDQADGSIRFETVIDPDHDWRVTEHVVAGQPVLPGSGYVEMAYAAALAVLGQVAFEVQSLSLAVPMVFAKGLPRRVSVQLAPVHNGFELLIESTANPAEAPLEHARAQIRLARYEDRERPAGLSDAAPVALAPRSGHAPQEVLIAFGPRWKNVGRVTLAEDIAEGVFDLAPAFASDLADHPLHPALLDMAATVGLHVLADAGAGDVVYVPMSVERIRVLHPLPMNVVARARRVTGEAGKFAAFDVVISTPDGIDVMIIEHLAMRAVAGGALQAAPLAASLTDQLLATGIRATEAGELLARVFAHSGRALVASPVPLDLVRLAMTDSARPLPPVKKRAGGSGGTIADPVSTRVAAIWGEILGIEAVGAEDDFFALGGHSLNAVRMFGRIRKEFGQNLPLATLFEAPTVQSLSALISARLGVVPVAEPGTAPTPAAAPLAFEWSPLVTISKGTQDIRPLYCVHGAGGNVLNFRALAGYLDPRIPFVGVRALGSDGGVEVDATIPAMAARYVEAMRQRQPHGPYRLAGYSGGGVIAFEMAQQVLALGEDVDHLVFLDSLAPQIARQGMTLAQKLWAARHWDMEFALGWFQRRGRKDNAHNASAEIARLLASGAPLPDDLIGPRMTEVYSRAQWQYEPASYGGPVTIFKAHKAQTLFLHAGAQLGWQGILTAQVSIHTIECDHFSMMSGEAVAEIGALLNRQLLPQELSTQP